MKVAIVIPTWNEKENITQLIQDILKIKEYNINIIIVDDNSPDQTSQEVEKTRTQHPEKIHLITRYTDKGRGNAGKTGFKEALQQQADIIIEMDADYSHHPKYIPTLIKATSIYDMVLGSRCVHSGKMTGRPWYRHVITYLANYYIRTIFWIKIWDCNSGYRAYKKEVLQKINPDKIQAQGPDIIQETLYKAHKLGFTIGEIPVTFTERTHGKSSLTIKKLLKGYTTVLKLKYKDLTGTLL